MHTHLYASGTPVRVRRGRFPLDRRLVGREGMIVDVDAYRPGRYAVQLDDEDDMRDFAEDELEPLVPDPKPESDLGSPGPNVRG